jgi:hypothetical protein
VLDRRNTTAFLKDVQTMQAEEAARLKEAEEIVVKHLPPQPRADAIRLLNRDAEFLDSVLRAPSLGLSNLKDHLLALTQCMCSGRSTPHGGSADTSTLA